MGSNKFWNVLRTLALMLIVEVDYAADGFADALDDLV
jgi:hypothetical protein